MVYPTPLPANPFVGNQLLETAFDHCLTLEQAPVTKEPLSSLISARLLGHLLHQLHITVGLGGADDVAKAIHLAAATNNPVFEMQKLAIEYLKYLIKTFKRASGPTPAPSVHISRDFEDHRASWIQIMEEGKLDHRTAKKYALRRDNFRCLVTGSVDLTSSFDGLVVPLPGESGALTEAAHIIPESANSNIRPGSNKEHHMGGVWEVLSCFAEDLQLPDSLKGNKIHRLDNIMTLETPIHGCFDRLWLWFKPVDPPVPHSYQTVAKDPLVPGVNRTVTFPHTDALPAPNPKYLALHALACEVAHMSGAAEYLERVYRDIEDGYLLASDGSSAHLLASALSLVAPVQ